MSVLVFTDDYDVHAKALKYSLNSDNILCDIWSTDNYPNSQNVSLFLDSNNTKEPVLKNPKYLKNSYLSVWARRFGLSNFPSNSLHPSDIKMARLETKRSITGIRHLLYKNSTWINPLNKKVSANIKAVQLFKHPLSLHKYHNI